MADEKKAAGLLGFLRAVLAHWFTAMSGPLSVPVAIAAFYVESQTAKVLLGLTAFICAWAAAYRVWKSEREKVLDLEDKLSPTKIREIAAQETHAAELRRHAEVLERQHRPPVIENMIESMRRKERVALGLERNPNALKIIVDSSPEFEEVHPRPDHVARTVLACAENTDANHFISNCKVSVEVSGGGTYQLVDSFTLNPTEKRFFPIATHHEAEIDKFIHIAVPRVGGFFAEAYNVRFPLTGVMITIKATSAETRPAQQICHLFVDDSGRLRLEKA